MPVLWSIFVSNIVTLLSVLSGLVFIMFSLSVILQVNGVSFVSLEHSHAVNTLRNSGQTVSMVIERL